MRAALAVLLLVLALPAWAQTYEGSYVCNQGATRLTLEVKERNGGSTKVLFEFGPSPTNPGVPQGSFMMVGMLSDSVLRLRPMYWVNHPPGFNMIGLVGSSTDGKTYAGTVAATFPGCTSFSVTRR